jgi:AbrB family looped-hinge helix DNA binding protein
MTDDVLLPKIATVTSKMQVTIPVRFARKYGLTPGSKVCLGVKNGRILLFPYRSTTKQLAQKTKGAARV